MDTWKTLADEQTIEKTVEALKGHNIEAIVVDSGEEAKQKVLEMIPKGAEVMTMSSVTLETIGFSDVINTSGLYDSVRQKLSAMDRQTQGREMQKLGAAPDWTIGSVQAVTQDGHILIASNTGSQLSSYTYGSAHVVWIVGVQKIVKNLEEGMKRLVEYIIPREDIHMHEKFGVGTHMNKLLTVYGELRPGRLTIIFVKELLGF